MPSKLQQKRRAGDDDSSSPARHSKKVGKNKREVAYDTYEEAIDGGVEYEEKGERYRDGDRAQRNYERSLELYQKAYELEQGYDSAYNQARVLYTLSTAFLLPPLAVDYLKTSIDLYRKASTLTEDSNLQLDAGFNLAQSCTTLADMLEELDDGNVEAVRACRVEGRDVLHRVLQGQEEYLRSATEHQDEEEAEESVDTVTDAEDEDGAAGMEVDGAVANEATYELHLPTVSSLLDTVLAHNDVCLALWISVDPLTPPDEPQQLLVRNALDLAAEWCPVGRQAELDMAEMKALLAMDGIIWDLYKSHAGHSAACLQSVEGACSALSRLLESLDEQTPDEPAIRAEIIMTLAESHTKIANRSMFLAGQLPPGPNPLAQQAWFHHSQTITYLTKALDLPTNPDTLREFRPSVLLQLSKASLARARLAPVNETAQRNLGQLIDNAVTYAGRAGDALSIPWVKVEAVMSSKADMVSPRGWDMEVLSKEVVLQQIRVCLFASEMELLLATRGRLNQGMAQLFVLLKGIPSDRRPGERDVRRWVDDLEDEEVALSETEKAWWEKVIAELVGTS